MPRGKIDKTIAKKLSGVLPIKKSKKEQKYIALRNIDRMKKEGWKLVEGKPASDLVLMEK